MFAAALAGTMLMSGVCVSAKGENPRVFVDDREVHFADQEPIIDSQSQRTLVPVRGVFEAMGASVNWNAEERTIMIDSKDNLTRLVLKIDDKIMEVWTAVTLMKYDKAEYELEAAPHIMNNRTMIPLRAIGENMAADVDWDGEDRIVDIHTKEYKKYIAKMTEENKGDDAEYTYSLKDNLANVSISSETESVSAGDSVTIDVVLSNSEAIGNGAFNGISAAVYYDSSKFEYNKAELIVDGEVYSNALGATNGEFMGDSVKSAMIVMPSSNDEDKIKLSDGTYLRYTFTSINGEGGEFVLSDRKTDRGFDTGFLVDIDGNRQMYEDYRALYIDTTPVVIEAK